MTTHRLCDTPTVALLATALMFTACSPADDAQGSDGDDPSGQADDDDDGAGDDDDDGQPGDDDDDDTGTGGTGGENECVPGVGDCPDGQKCQPYVKEDGNCCVDADKCVPVTGNKKAGEDCTRERYGDDCEKDAFCFAGTSGKEGAGYCKQLCDGTDPESCVELGMPNAICQQFNNGKLPLCEIPCHPLRPTCDEPTACYWGGGGLFLCSRPDPEPGKGKDGDDCYTLQSCNPGLTCQAAAGLEGCDSDYCCTPFCDATGSAAECAAPETCVAMFTPDDPEIDPQYFDVGVCGLAEN